MYPFAQPATAMFKSFIAVVAAAWLVAGSSAFKLDKFDDNELDALFAGLPPAGTKETSSGTGYSTTSFREIGFAQTSCESSADSSMFEDYVEAYVEAVVNVVKKSCTPFVNNLEQLKEDMEEFAFAWAEGPAQNQVVSPMDTCPPMMCHVGRIVQPWEGLCSVWLTFVMLFSVLTGRCPFYQGTAWAAAGASPFEGAPAVAGFPSPGSAPSSPAGSRTNSLSLDEFEI